MQTQTATQVFETIQNEAATADDTMRFYRVHTIGHELRQGDVYLLPMEMPDLTNLKQTADMQLAPGASKGSRHIMTGKCRIFERESSDPLVGPAVIVDERCILTHPEHAHMSLPPGAYSARFQIDLQREERARVAD